MAALLNPTSRRLAAAACRRIFTPAAAGALISHRISQERYSSSLVDVRGGFSEMLEATQRYYVVGGKGVIGKTSMAALLAVKFASHGEPTLVVSTDQTRSLGDSFEQDMSVGKAVRIDGFDSLFATEIAFVKKAEHPGVRSFISNLLGRLGLGTHADLTMLFEMLNRLPPGLEEAYALSELIKSTEQQGTDKFRRILLDTPSTVHTLKLLSVNNWIEKFLSWANKGGNAVSSMPEFKLPLEKWQVTSAWLEESRQQFARVCELLSDPRST